MLKVFRENLKHLAWILWLVIAAFILLVFGQWGAGGFQGSVPAGSAATVGEMQISFREFERQYRQLEENVRRLYGQNFGPDLARQLRLPIQALDSLIAQKILLLEAQKLGLATTDRELREAILELPQVMDENGRFSNERYFQFVRSLGYSVADFEREMRNQLLLDKINTMLAETAYVSAVEIEQASREQAERASIRYLRLPPAQFGSQATVDESELADYFASHAEEYRLPERRVIAYLQVTTSSVQASLEIGEEELRAHYDQNLDDFTQEEQVRARHILLFANDTRSEEDARSELAALRKRIEQGEDFATLAREASEDTGSKTLGGELGFFARGQMNPAFEEAAFNAGVGDLVGPIRTTLGNQIGFHLIQVEDRREGGTQGFEEVRQRIRDRLASERAREVGESKSRELYDRIEKENLTTEHALRALADQEGIDFSVTPPFGQNDNVPGIGRGTGFTVAAFELQPGQVSEPVQLRAGWAILSLKEVLEPRLPELGEVEAQVRGALVQDRQLQLATERLEGLRAEMETGTKGLDEVAEELGVPLEESGEFGRRDVIRGLGFQQPIVDAALSLEEGGVGGPISTPQGPVLFQVTERQHWDPVEFEQNKGQTRRELKERRVDSLLLSVIEQRRLELGFQYSPQVLESFGLGETGPGGVPAES